MTRHQHQAAARIREERATQRELEVRAEAEGVPSQIAGHAAVFDVETEIWPGSRMFEVVRPGAFRKSIQEGRNVLGLFGHDTSQPPLSTTRSSTLRLVEDDTGLAYEMDLDGRVARHVEVGLAVQTRRVDGSSFGFRVVKDESIERTDGSVLRQLLEVELYDVSPVNFPAYSQTDVVALQRSIEARAALERAGLTETEVYATISTGLRDSPAPVADDLAALRESWKMSERRIVLASL